MPCDVCVSVWRVPVGWVSVCLCVSLCVFMCVCVCVCVRCLLGKDRVKPKTELKAVNEKVKETDTGIAEKLRQVRSRVESDLERDVCFICPL